MAEVKSEWTIALIPNAYMVLQQGNGKFGHYWLEAVEGWQVCPNFMVFDATKDDHTISNSEEHPLGTYLSERIPLSHFYGKVDGDTVELKFKGKSLVAKIDQSKSKYDAMCFKDYLLHKFNFGGVYKPEIGELSQEEQRKLIVETCKKTAESYGETPKDESNFGIGECVVS